jgi:PPIC-type PPIASE domain
MLTQNNKFDPARYQQLVEGLRQNFGVTEIQFQDMIRQSLILDAARGAIVSPVFVNDAEIEKSFADAYGPVTLQAVNFDDAKFKKQVKVTPAEIEEEYRQDVDRNPAYRTPERRKIACVTFLLDAEQQKLDAKQQEAAREALAQQAIDLALALEPSADPSKPRPDFKATASGKGLTVTETEFFAADEPAKPLKPSPTLNQAVFDLTKERPISGNISLEDGFAVAQLVEIQPSQPKPLTEVKKQVEDAIIARKTFEAMREAGRAAQKQLAEAIAAGIPFEKKAKELGLAAETLPPFVPADAETMKDPKLAAVAGLAFSLKPGEISEFVPTQGGGSIAYLQSRGAPDAEKYGMFKTRISTQLTQSARGETMEEWFRLAEASPGTKPPQFLNPQTETPSAPQ